MPNPFTQIPATVRKWIYLAYGIVGLFLGGCQVIDVSTLGDFPVIKALALLAYVGTALGFTAASNVTQTNTAVVEAPADVEIHAAPADSDTAALEAEYLRIGRILGKA